MTFAASCEKHKLMVNSGNNSLSKIKHPPQLGRQDYVNNMCSKYTRKFLLVHIKWGRKRKRKR
jgi:hypothetical protein